MTMAILLKDIRNLIIDMDGVLWHGNKAIPGMPTFFQTLRRLSIRFVLATNNAGRSGQEYVAKLAGLGAEIAADEVLTSSQATADYIVQSAPNARVYVAGSPSIGSEMVARGLTVLADKDAQTATHVVMGGIVGHLTYDKMAEACMAIRAGAIFVGTNPDITFPGERGIIPGNGALLEAMRLATNVAPIIIGKPEPEMMRQAMRRMGDTATSANTAAIGDRLDTDILGAQRAGLSTLLVLTGITSAEQAATDPIRADYVFDSIREITQALQEPLPKV